MASGLDLKQIISVEQMEEAISKQVSKLIVLNFKLPAFQIVFKSLKKKFIYYTLLMIGGYSATIKAKWSSKK